jgi:TDG/mug DNA glycosylase family protein
VAPTPEQLAGAEGLTIPDLIGPGLHVLFCGINPSLLSGYLGLHFARPGNRFWRLLHGAGFTDRVLPPAEQHQLLDQGIGITNLVAPATRRAADLTTEQLRAGARQLAITIARWRPEITAIVGMQAYRVAFQRPLATVGEQPEDLAGGRLWLLPNPSGLQARYPFAEMVAMFAELRAAIDSRPDTGGPRRTMPTDARRTTHTDGRPRPPRR